MKTLHHTPLALTLALCLSQTAPAEARDEARDLLELKHTVVNLVDALVAQGILDKKQAAALIEKAERDAAQQAAKTLAAPELAAGAAAAPLSTPDGKPVVRVGYVPEVVKQEIRSQLRAEMRADILADVSEKARQEKWGTPGALPAWLSAISLYGDARLRNQFDVYDSNNPDTLGGQNLYLDILAINRAGGIGRAGVDAFLNTSDDKNFWRERVRLGLTARISDQWSFDTRITTGRPDSPVSANAALATYGQRFSVQMDRAQLKYDLVDRAGLQWLSLSAGRIPNPWFSTDMVWDEDLGFDGVAGTFRHSIDFGRGVGLNPSTLDRKAYFTFGVFPIQQPDFVDQDKYLAGGQLGADWQFDNQSLLRLGVAFYDFIHETGKRNAFGSTVNNETAPQWLQKGNLLFNIANTPDPVNDPSGLNSQLFALASEYRLIDFNVSLDFAQLAPHHVILNANVVKNIGFDEEEILRRTGGQTYLYPIKDRTLGVMAGVQVGWPQITRFGAWQVVFDYRYLQRDAVLDAFTDSVFHIGGTDTQGFRIGGLFGLNKHMWVRGRWISSTEIDGPPLAIDTLQFDLNARF
ncbi:MAG: hypothetical protein RL434_389 [Pseudomonadota bacterium]